MPEQRVGLAYEVESKEAEKRLATVTKLLDGNKAAVQAVRKEISNLTNAQGKMTEKRREDIKVLRKQKFDLEELGRFYQAQVSQQREAARETEQAAKRREQAEARVARETKRAQEQTRREYERTRKAMGLNIKKLILWSLGARTAFRIFSKFRRELRDATIALYGNTEEWKRMEKAVSRAVLSLVASLGELAGVPESLDFISQGFEALGQVIIIAGAGTIAFKNDLIATVGWAKLALEGASAQELIAYNLAAAERSRAEEAEYFKNVLTAVDQAMADAEDKTKDYTSTIKSAVNAIRKSNAALTEHRAALEEVRQEYRVAYLKAGGDFFRETEKINRELQEAITEINAGALADRERALAQANKRMQHQQQQANRNLEKLEAQHELQMEYNRRRYELTQIQNERMYQYQRGLLVAEGDVLAIEDLDARHELEKQAREENFRLQQQQAEAMFQLQLRFQRQAAREQAKILRESLMEQLALIEERRRDELDEAQASATEQQAQAADAAADAKTDALAALKEQEKDLEESNEKRLESEIEFWVNMLQEEGVGKDAIIQFLKNVYGPEFTGEMETIATQIISDSERASATFEAAWKTALLSVKSEALATLAAIQAVNQAGIQIRQRGRPVDLRGPEPEARRGHQYGGEFIASRPTTITVGEGGRPERVIVQPMQASMRGQMNVSWTGGAIPVHGSGSLSGADMGAFGQALAQGVATGIKSEFSGFRGQRGQ